jgi:hypothetical protein
LSEEEIDTASINKPLSSLNARVKLVMSAIWKDASGNLGQANRMSVFIALLKLFLYSVNLRHH